METSAPYMQLNMPKSYDFSTKSIDWNKYKPYYLLRTDAVWEKSKLYQYFYSLYKAPLYFNKDKYYRISELFQYESILHQRGGKLTYDEIGENATHHKEARPYNIVTDGGLFEFDIVSNKQFARKTSNFMGDWAKDTTLLCMIKFMKWMKCNEKSNYKISNLHEYAESIVKYDCFEELQDITEHCIMYHWKVMFEMYYFRVYNDYTKFRSAQRMTRPVTFDRRPNNAKILYY